MEEGSVEQGNRTKDVKKGETVGPRKKPVCSTADVKLFHEACGKGDLFEVIRLVSEGIVDVNCRGEDGETAVMAAADMMEESVFDFLVESNADLLLLDEDNYNVLHYACGSGSVYIVKKLLDDHKMKTDKVTYDEDYPLTIALHEGHIPVVKLLLDRGVDITPNEYQEPLLHEACFGGKIEMVKYVLSFNNTDLDRRGSAGRTPLTYAADGGHVSVFKFLRDYGADVNTIDDVGNNILINACVYGHVKMITYILSLNIYDVNYKGQFGRTAFMHSLRHEGRKIAKLLRRKGSDMTVLDVYNNSILHLACEFGHVDMVKYVLSLNVSDIETRGRSGRTPIMIAVLHGKTEVVKILHKQHNASLTKCDDEGRCVLHLACQSGRLDLLKYLSTFDELTPFKDKKDKDGVTP